MAACHGTHQFYSWCSATAISASYHSFLHFICFTDLLWLGALCVCVWHQNPLLLLLCAARPILRVVLSRSWCSVCCVVRVALIISFLLLFTSVIILSSPPSRLRSLPAPHLISSLCQPFVGSWIHTAEALQHNYPKYDAGLFGLELSPKRAHTPLGVTEISVVHSLTFEDQHEVRLGGTCQQAVGYSNNATMMKTLCVCLCSTVK